MDNIVMPVHSDEKYLPFALRALEKFEGQIIFVLDNPTAASEDIVGRFVKNHTGAQIVNKGNLSFEMENPAFSSFIFGSLEAKGDRIFWMAADMIAPQEMFRADLKLPAQFECIDYPNHLGYAWFKLLSKFTKHYSAEAFPKNFPYQHYDWRSEERIFLTKSKAIEFNHYNFVILHLRRTTNRTRHFVQGVLRKRLGFNPLKVFLHSILFLKPFVIIGYLSETMKRRK
jgi:hypothetical protein